MPKPQKQIEDEALCVLMSHLFHKYFCPDEDITDELKGTVLPVYFLGWVDKQSGFMDPATVCEEAGVDISSWELLKRIIEGNVGPERIAPIWPNITLGVRPMPKHKLKSFTWNMILQYEDGFVTPIQVHVSRDMLGGPGFHDSTLGMLIASRAKEFMEPVINAGIDGMHEKGELYDENCFNMLMGAFLQIIPQLKAEFHDRLKNWMRLCQFIIAPPIPPDVKQEIARRRAANSPSTKPLGGWDVDV